MGGWSGWAGLVENRMGCLDVCEGVPRREEAISGGLRAAFVWLCVLVYPCFARPTLARPSIPSHPFNKLTSWFQIRPFLPINSIIPIFVPNQYLIPSLFHPILRIHSIIAFLRACPPTLTRPVFCSSQFFDRTKSLCSKPCSPKFWFAPGLG